jgi:hypothetical protein
LLDGVEFKVFMDDFLTNDAPWIDEYFRQCSSIIIRFSDALSRLNKVEEKHPELFSFVENSSVALSDLEKDPSNLRG